MTLIIKELIIKGEVIDDPFFNPDSGIDEGVLMEKLSQMKDEITKDCIETILERLIKNPVR